MPRIRSLKYEYFINEDLAQISLEARLLGLGLTTLADREGRLEDRPLRIKVLLFPYHDVDVDKSLDELQTSGFLERYVVDGKPYISVVNFLKHQRPHPREVPSVIPSREKVRPRQIKARPSREKETKPASEEIPCQTQPGGLGDLGLGVSVSGNGSSVSGDGDPVGTGASATSEIPSGSKLKDLKNAGEFTVWGLGVGKLMAVGMEEQPARSFLGGLCKEYGKDAVSAAITKMLAQEPADPKTYLVAVLQGQNGTRLGMSKVDHGVAAAQRVAAKYEQRS